jgi:hypothetical protein
MVRAIAFLVYFGIIEVLSPLRELDKWFRRRLRCYAWKQWGRGAIELRKRGVSVRMAWNTSKSALGPWRISKTPALSLTLPASFFSAMGLPQLAPARMKQQCCPNMPNRRIMRSVHERSRDVARAIADTPQYRQSRRDRKKVEMLFAHLKRILKLDRLRLRGLTGAHDEFLLAATAQNLRRMAKRLLEGQQTKVAMPA